MSGGIDLARLRDPLLRPIAGKVTRGAAAGGRETALASTPRRTCSVWACWPTSPTAVNGDRVFFSANQHINPTNVCVLRNTCTFCSFARMPKEEGAYTRSLEEVFSRGGAGDRHADPRVPHRRRAPSQAPAELLHRHDPGVEAAPPPGAYQSADRGGDRPPGADREDLRARGARSP